MKIEFESGKSSDPATLADLQRISYEGFSILSKGDEIYMQCAQNPDVYGEFVLEYRDGSADMHFEAADAPHTLENIASAFQKYLEGDESWRDDFQWEKLNL